MTIHDMMTTSSHHVAARAIDVELRRLSAEGVLSVRPAVSTKGLAVVHLIDAARGAAYLNGSELLEALRAAQPVANPYGEISGLEGARQAVAKLRGLTP